MTRPVTWGVWADALLSAVVPRAAAARAKVKRRFNMGSFLTSRGIPSGNWSRAPADKFMQNQREPSLRLKRQSNWYRPIAREVARWPRKLGVSFFLWRC